MCLLNRHHIPCGNHPVRCPSKRPQPVQAAVSDLKPALRSGEEVDLTVNTPFKAKTKTKSKLSPFHGQLSYSGPLPHLSLHLELADLLPAQTSVGVWNSNPLCRLFSPRVPSVYSTSQTLRNFKTGLNQSHLSCEKNHNFSLFLFA